MNSKRVLAATSVGLAAALTLAACSSGGDGESGDTLTIAYQKTSSFVALDDLMNRVKDEYEAAYPERNVELVAIEGEQDQYFTRLALMNGSSSTAPDVIYEDTFQIRSDAAAGYLQPLDEYLAGWDEWDQFMDSAKQAGVGDDGQTYGVSLGTDTRGLYYNKELFAEAGLPTDWQPETWDEVLDAARTIKQALPDVIPLNIYGGRAQGEATSMQGFEMLLYGTGDELMDTSTGKWLTGTQGFEDALTFYDTMFTEELGPDPAQALDAGWQSRVSNDLIPNGELAIALDGSWLPSNWMAGDNAWPEWTEVLGFAAMPTQDGQGAGFVSMSGGWTLAMGSQADDPQAAFDFIAMALNRENSLAYYQENGQIAVRSDIADDPEYLDYNPSFEFFSSLVQYTFFRPATPDYSQISALIPAATESVLTGQAEPADAAATYDEGLIGIVGEENTREG
ncbi:extracellular solute-binding protein [Demequina sp. NBRC 110052]|uniref:extracellular solute-binding protein n=1 Tax=Demequina sp. NBRC 110052 TaxID=1570341 RepID=UPI0009FFAA98|nr:extracellular solute-binding protein [Demequina sp. NBRC 110052]